MLKPLHNYILLEPVLEENITAGGIIIPDSAAQKPSRGRVAAIGTDKEIQVAVGDTVLFAKWAATANEVKLDGRDYVLIKETDILGVL